MTRVVFLGPSLPASEARALVTAELRPPVRRGDLATLPVDVHAVALIDGVFDQSLAVSPAEIRALLARGVTVIGGASMGALRAVELSSLGMIGVGDVFDDFAAGRLVADDEVALLFDPDTQRALSTALVTIRHATRRAVDAGWLSAEHADAIVRAAAARPYPERDLRRALRDAAIADHDGALVRRLAVYDVKADDARRVLARLATT